MTNLRLDGITIKPVDLELKDGVARPVWPIGEGISFEVEEKFVPAIAQELVNRRWPTLTWDSAGKRLMAKVYTIEGTTAFGVILSCDPIPGT